jgi:hypothetical protein
MAAFVFSNFSWVFFFFRSCRFWDFNSIKHVWNFNLCYQQLHLTYIKQQTAQYIPFLGLYVAGNFRTAPRNHSSEPSRCHSCQPAVRFACHWSVEHATAYSCFLSADIRYPTINIWRFSPPKTKIKFSPEGPKPGHLRPNGILAINVSQKHA